MQDQNSSRCTLCTSPYCLALPPWLWSLLDWNPSHHLISLYHWLPLPPLQCGFSMVPITLIMGRLSWFQWHWVGAPEATKLLSPCLDSRETPNMDHKIFLLQQLPKGPDIPRYPDISTVGEPISWFLLCTPKCNVFKQQILFLSILRVAGPFGSTLAPLAGWYRMKLQSVGWQLFGLGGLTFTSVSWLNISRDNCMWPSSPSRWAEDYVHGGRGSQRQERVCPSSPALSKSLLRTRFVC